MCTFIKLTITVFILAVLGVNARHRGLEPRLCPTHEDRWSPTILLPDPEDCQSFHICAHGKPVKMQCLDGLQFNPKLKVCDWPENVKCEFIRTTSAPASENSTTPEIESTNSTSTSSTTSDIETTIVTDAPLEITTAPDIESTAGTDAPGEASKTPEIESTIATEASTENPEIIQTSEPETTTEPETTSEPETTLEPETTEANEEVAETTIVTAEIIISV